MPTSQIKVLVIDDSALIRHLLTEIINSHADLTVVACAPDPIVARELIKLHNPDVLTLDVEMPRMDGLEFLERLMRLRPMPVLMVSSLTEEGSNVTLKALELGAVDFISKPKMDIAAGLKSYSDLIAEKLRTCASAHVRSRPSVESSVKRHLVSKGYTSTEKVIFVGASTGGTEAIRHFLEPLPADMPAIMITQHMPENFTRTFAERLDKLCQLNVQEARHNTRVLPGHVYIAPGNAHLEIVRSGANYMTSLNEGEPVNRHRPSVDVLFMSAARIAGANAIAVILTGMGKDGALGMKVMKEAGAITFAQNEESCIVFGMPKEAIALGVIDEVLPLDVLPSRVLEQVGQRTNRV